MTQSFTPTSPDPAFPANPAPGPALGVAVFGAANVDISAAVELAFVPGDSTPGRIATTAGGVARNIAENLARLGLGTHLISAVGDDVQGQFLLDHCRRAGVDVSSCGVWPNHATGVYLSLHQPDGSLLGAVNDMAVLNLLGPDELARCGDVVDKTRAWSAWSAWVVDCNLSEASIGWLMQRQAQFKTLPPIFVDGVSSHKCIRVLPWLAHIHTLKINRLEAQALTGMPVKSAGDAMSAAQNLCERGVENAVVSLGQGGVCWYQRSSMSSGHAPALAVAAVNSNGAGDALSAGLVYGALAGWPLAQSARFANACAALTLTTSAANHPQLSVALAEKWMAQ